MRKGDLTGLMDLLSSSVIEIAASGAENRDELLHKSLDEFAGALGEQIEPYLQVERELPLAKSVSHIGLFWDALRDAARGIELFKVERPDLADEADRFIDVGLLTLRAMANAVAEPVDEADAGDAELVKIEGFDGTETLLKSDLPDDLCEYLTDPVELVEAFALMARSFSDDAVVTADVLNKMDLLPAELAEAYPELFEPLAKKGFPPGLKKPQQPGMGQQQAQQGAPPGTPDEEDPDQDPSQQDPSQQEMQPQDDGTDPAGADDAAQNPIEMITRLASIIVVVAGSLMQAQGGEAAEQDPNNAPAGPEEQLQRQVPLEDIPLEKILRGEIVVSASLADALEERETLRKSNVSLTEQQNAAQIAMRKMQETIDRLHALPAPAKGALFAMGKTEDHQLGAAGQPSREDEVRRIDALAKTNPEAASRALLKIVHTGGGTPLVPPR